MKKLILLLFFIIILNANLFAQNEWQTTIKIKANNVDSLVIFGQKNEATNGFDAAYDVPFFGSGSLSTYFVGEGGNLFKDLHALNNDSTWTLRIEIKDPNITKVELFWRQDSMPPDYDIYMYDPLENIRLNMKNVNYYSFANTGIRYLDIETKKIN